MPVRGSCSGVAGACSRWRLRAASFCPLSPAHAGQTSALWVMPQGVGEQTINNVLRLTWHEGKGM